MRVERLRVESLRVERSIVERVESVERVRILRG